MIDTVFFFSSYIFFVFVFYYRTFPILLFLVIFLCLIILVSIVILSTITQLLLSQRQASSYLIPAASFSPFHSPTVVSPSENLQSGFSILFAPLSYSFFVFSHFCTTIYFFPQVSSSLSASPTVALISSSCPSLFVPSSYSFSVFCHFLYLYFFFFLPTFPLPFKLHLI